MDHPLDKGSQKFKSTEKRVPPSNHTGLLLPCPVLQETMGTQMTPTSPLKAYETSQQAVVDQKVQEPNMYNVGSRLSSLPGSGQQELPGKEERPS